jgi:endonuclease/exonuclease/phosphatase family metal-dependent hydrolase
MTTNIVAAGDLDAQATFDEGYGITWAERVAIQADMIMTYLPDFIGLQEMQEHPDVNGYEGYMHSVMEENTCTEYSFVIYEDLPRSEYWTPIMYRSTLWQVEAKGFLPCWDNAMHRLQWALFSRKDNPDEKYILINLHNPTSNSIDWQWKAAQETNELFLRLRDEYGVPIFITGDFNITPAAPAYAELVKHLTDVNEVTAKDRRNTFHGYDPSVKRDQHIDYCFANDKVTPNKWELIDATVDGKFPSDHYGVYVELTI